MDPTATTAAAAEPTGGDPIAILARHHPLDLLPAGLLADLVDAMTPARYAAGATLQTDGDAVARVLVIVAGAVVVTAPSGERLQDIAVGGILGADSILDETAAVGHAVATAPVTALVLDAAPFLQLVAAEPAYREVFQRGRGPLRRRPADAGPAPAGTLFTALLGSVMTPDPVTIPREATVREAAAAMGARSISCVLVTDGPALAGLLTTGDLAHRVVAPGLSPETPVGAVMTADPMTFPPNAVLHDAMVAMSERRIGHLPVTVAGRPVGIITRTDLVRRQSESAVHVIGDIARARTKEALPAIAARVPRLIAQFVGAGVDAHHVAAVVTSVTDALTRRLIGLAEAALGPAPVPYLWLACGSQGRREQTGASDQDNCLILDDSYDPAAHGAWFEAFARFVSDGLHAAGYVYCPGDMMATNPQWRQPVSVWRGYFARWIARPDPMAQMLASVMFDLRPIHGTASLFAGLQRQTLDLARANSIFRAHMIANSLKHTPPLGLFRGLALIRSGDHKDTIDLKHSGIVPIVDLARIYALDAGLEVVNTRERLAAAKAAGSLSTTAADDLIDAFDLISDIRIEHQSVQIRAGGKPDNYVAPARLSALERGHLRDAFAVVKALQSSLAQVRGLS
ncbi:DUF294 nucleotidyltransferase-like domain-containing protein [Mongoliimonas terrestris]|uniref:DUF294 nucleotidyltransferase-like domain-containing protein n=1 Tax=Mongoliimonas terrestris TaxID=1709001 RepID=UPI0009494F9C|nr:DUF294 nucleotidyltransferase-like domain-containing protein [Mongoliimonas terrestris]